MISYWGVDHGGGDEEISKARFGNSGKNFAAGFKSRGAGATPAATRSGRAGEFTGRNRAALFAGGATGAGAAAAGGGVLAYNKYKRDHGGGDEEISKARFGRAPKFQTVNHGRFGSTAEEAARRMSGGGGIRFRTSQAGNRVWGQGPGARRRKIGAGVGVSAAGVGGGGALVYRERDRFER